MGIQKKLKIMLRLSVSEKGKGNAFPTKKPITGKFWGDKPLCGEQWGLGSLNGCAPGALPPV